MYSQPQADALSYINATTGDAATVFGPALLGLVRSDARAARRSVSVLFAAVRGWAASVPEVPPHHLPTQLATRLAAAKASAAAAAAADPAAEAVSWLVPLRPVAYAAALLGLCLIVCARRLAAARRGLARARRPEELLQARGAERRRDETSRDEPRRPAFAYPCRSRGRLSAPSSSCPERRARRRAAGTGRRATRRGMGAPPRGTREPSWSTLVGSAACAEGSAAACAEGSDEAVYYVARAP